MTAGTHRVRVAPLLVALAAGGTAIAQVDSQADVPPEQRPRPVMQATALETAPVVDGIVIGDPAWEGLVPAAGFTQVQPLEGAPATQETVVYVGYTNSALYIGVMAYDDNPANIIVADSRRDSELDETDSFQVIIDGLKDRQNGYLFGTNPAGVEYDAQVVKEGSTGQFGSGGGGFNLNWDGSWTVEAAITEQGWSAEFEIPFTTLRYGNADEQEWGINFQRNIRNNNEVVYWAPLNRQRNIERISEAGTLAGIRPPASRNLQFTPYGLASGPGVGRWTAPTATRSSASTSSTR